MRKLVAALAVVSAVVGWSSSALAVGYTLSSSIILSNGPLGISGTLDPVASLSGTSICLVPTCGTSASHDWLVFTVTLNLGSNPVDQVSTALTTLPATQVAGVGHFSDPGRTPTGGSIPGVSPGYIDFGFGSVNLSNLQPGETSDRLFAAFALGTLPGPGIFPAVPPGTVSFMIGKAGGSNFSATGTIVAIPEPGTLLLLGAGLLGLGFASRRPI